MSLKIDVNYLSKEDLEYELAIRGFHEECSVEEMRSCLRRLLKLEREGKLIARSPRPINEEEEISTVERRIKDLKILLQDASSDKLQKIHRKVDATVTHLLNRATRIESTDPMITDRRSKALNKLLKVMELIMPLSTEEVAAEETIIPVQDRACATNSEDPPEQQNPNQQFSGQDVEDAEVETPHIGSRNLMFSRHDGRVLRTQTPIKDWGLKFSGGSGASLLAFLDDLDHYRQARNATERDLFYGAIDLFSGPALVWFRSVRKKVSSWEELEKKLREDFLEEDFEDGLLAEISNRTQNRNETFRMYVAVMESSFAQLPTPLSEARKLKIIMDNSLPYFYEKLRMYNPRSIEELLRCGSVT